jgi:hypothetical protein
MRRDYTNVGQKKLLKEQIDNAISSLSEFEPFRTTDLPFCQGEGIKKIVNECKVPLSKITRMALHGGGHEFAMYAIEVDYKNALVKLYIIDDGCSVCVGASDVLEKQTVNA